MMDWTSLWDHLNRPIYEPQAGDYAELADEYDEHGTVNICREDGRVIISMPYDVWDSLRKASE